MNSVEELHRALDELIQRYAAAADPQFLQQVMSTNPAYLRSAADGEVVQYRDWGIPLGRRFRALKLWFHLRLDGPEAIRQRLRRDLENAHWFAVQVEAQPGWDVLAPVPFHTICIRHTPLDSHGVKLAGEDLDQPTLAWVESINASGEAFLTPSVLDDRWMARESIGVEGTTREQVVKLWHLLQEAAARQAQSLQS
mgnify:CR=1 FL=1